MMIQNFKFFFVLLFFSVIVSESSWSDTIWPTQGWSGTNIQRSNAQKAHLEKMYRYISDNKLGYESIIITRNGELLEEKYFPGISDTATALFSVTKSINALLVGKLVDKGLIINENDAVLKYLPHQLANVKDNRVNEISIKHVLNMTCGFDWNEYQYPYNDPRNIFYQWVRGKDRVGFLLSRRIVNEPGSVFNYNTAASHLITAMIQRITGETALAFANKYLFIPLGIEPHNVIWGKDAMGINKGGGLNMRPLDMAKIGYLVLRKGRWENQQIIPESWIDKSIRPAVSIGYKRDFGYHWYINQYKKTKIISAEGYKEQFIYIVPSFDAVIVFTANILKPTNHSYKILTEYILPFLN